MTPAPSLQDLIDAVRADAAAPEPLLQLTQASAMVGQLEEVGDAVLGHFVDQCRRAGHSWTQISEALGVSRQAAHKRFTGPGPAGAPSWERFTPRARAAVQGAADEAAALGHGFVGTEHLLLALFAPPEALGAQVLAEAGLTHEKCRAELRKLIGEVPVPPGPAGERPYTARALEALRGAVEEALALGHNYVGTEHLLLALFRDPSSVAAQALAGLGATRADLVARVTTRLSAITARKAGA
jgi:hypothetical protein